MAGAKAKQRAAPKTEAAGSGPASELPASGFMDGVWESYRKGRSMVFLRLSLLMGMALVVLVVVHYSARDFESSLAGTVGTALENAETQVEQLVTEVLTESVPTLVGESDSATSLIPNTTDVMEQELNTNISALSNSTNDELASSVEERAAVVTTEGDVDVRQDDEIAHATPRGDDTQATLRSDVVQTNATVEDDTIAVVDHVMTGDAAEDSSGIVGLLHEPESEEDHTGILDEPQLLPVLGIDGGQSLRSGSYLVNCQAAADLFMARGVKKRVPRSCKDRFMYLQGDGNLVVYSGTGPHDNQGVVWATNTICINATVEVELHLSREGELRLMHDQEQVWTSGRNKKHKEQSSYKLELDDRGILKIVNDKNKSVWRKA